MTRSQDLDTIAPDDEIIVSGTTQTPKEEVQETKEIKKKFKKKKIEIEEEPVPNEEFHKKVHDICGHSKSSLSGFLVHPRILTFAEQGDDETIYLAVRPHWINNISWVFIAILMLFVPLFFKYFSFLNFFPGQYQFAIILFWYLMTFIYSFEKFLSWYFDLYLVTDQRVIDIDFNNLLNKHFAEADIAMVQDVSTSIRGVLGTFFNFGDVLIQTASETNQINFEKVPNPEKIIKLFKELRDLEEQKKGGENDR
ncbi:MAG: hypothetical protein WCG91_01365 [Candidatus Shapirobacteria bacterium]